jgi:hypothetical protein
LRPITNQENENGTHVECNRAHSDCGTLRHDGVMSAAGSVYIAKSIFSAKTEQIFFGLFLIPIAGFYLAFTVYFGDNDTWQLEATAVAVFAVFGLVGVRVPFAPSSDTRYMACGMRSTSSTLMLAALYRALGKPHPCH